MTTMSSLVNHWYITFSCDLYFLNWKIQDGHGELAVNEKLIPSFGTKFTLKFALVKDAFMWVDSCVNTRFCQ